MSDSRNWMDSFRAKNGGNVYVLQVKVIEGGRTLKDIREVVDCPKGEVGVLYAANLLCRLANEAARGTKMETCQWRRFHALSAGEGRNHRYKKFKDSENYVKAEMVWQEKAIENVFKS